MVKNNAIIVSRKISLVEKNYILNLINSSIEDYDVFLTNELFFENLDDIEFEIIELSDSQKSKINSEIFQNIIDFGEVEIKGKPISDIFKIENMSFWHYYKFRVYFFIRNAFFEIQLINQYLNNYNNIELFTDNQGWKYYKFDSERLNIQFPNLTKENYNYFNIIKYSLFFLFRSIVGLFQIKSLKKSKHIVIDHSIKQAILDINTLELKKGNYNLEYLFEELDNDFIILDEKEFPKLKGKSKFFNLDFNLFPKRKTLFGEIILLSGLFSSKIRKKTNKLNNKLEDIFREVSNSKFSPVNEFIFSYFHSIPAKRLLIFKYLSYSKFFKGFENIQSISSIDENSPRIKSIFDAAKKSGVITFGIQHGTIHVLHPSYIYSKKDTQRKPFPDYNILWGKYWKEILNKKGNYPLDSLILAGQIRTDVIPKLIENSQNDLGINPLGKKIIMFASQFQRDESLREKAALDLFSAVKLFSDYLLIVKLHPSEKNEFEYYHNLAKIAGCSNYKILYYYDLYKLLSLSKIVVTCFSTVGAEAVYFYKPLIIIDHLKQDIQNYKKAGVAFQATNGNEIRNIIKLLDSNQISIDKTKYDDFISQYAYKIDGKVSKRIIQTIKSYSNK